MKTVERNRSPPLNLVDFPHQSFGFGQGDDDFWVVVNFVPGERAVFAVFEVFLRGEVAADGEVPDGLRDGAEVLGVVQPNSAEAAGAGGGVG